MSLSLDWLDWGTGRIGGTMANCLCSQLTGFGDFLNFGDLMTGAQIKLCLRDLLPKMRYKTYLQAP